MRRRLRDIGDAHDYLARRPRRRIPPRRDRQRVSPAADFQRLTDEVGINESPTISPDGKMVAFVAAVNGRQQVWIRLLTGGAPLQLTRDDVDHLLPALGAGIELADLLHAVRRPGDEGALWEVSALGGLPRPIIGALGGGDISHDGRRIALLRADEGGAGPDDGRARRVGSAACALVPHGHIWRVAALVARRCMARVSRPRH